MYTDSRRFFPRYTSLYRRSICARVQASKAIDTCIRETSGNVQRVYTCISYGSIGRQTKGKCYQRDCKVHRSLYASNFIFHRFIYIYVCIVGSRKSTERELVHLDSSCIYTLIVIEIISFLCSFFLNNFRSIERWLWGGLKAFSRLERCNLIWWNLIGKYK